MSIKQKSILYSLLATLGLTGFYLIIMFLTMTPREVWLNFNEFWYLIVGIIIGFGVQIGLWVYVKNCGSQDHGAAVSGTSGAVSGGAMIVPHHACSGAGLRTKVGSQDKHSVVLPSSSGVVSGGAMIACCAHHLADVIPILGLSGAAIFLAQYQKSFLVLGLSINLLGIAYMLNLLRKHTPPRSTQHLSQEGIPLPGGVAAGRGGLKESGFMNNQNFWKLGTRIVIFVVDNEELKPLADEVEAIFKRVIDGL